MRPAASESRTKPNALAARAKQRALSAPARGLREPRLRSLNRGTRVECWADAMRRASALGFHALCVHSVFALPVHIAHRFDWQQLSAMFADSTSSRANRHRHCQTLTAAANAKGAVKCRRAITSPRRPLAREARDDYQLRLQLLVHLSSLMRAQICWPY